MTMVWTLFRGTHPEVLGFIPSFLDPDDPRPAAEQFNARYIAGWHPFEGFTLLGNGDLKYTGDPPLHPLAMTNLRDEQITFYEYAWVMIMQPDGSWEVARMD